MPVEEAWSLIQQLPPDEAAAVLGEFEEERLPELLHGISPAHLARFFRLMPRPDAATSFRIFRLRHVAAAVVNLFEGTIAGWTAPAVFLPIFLTTLTDVAGFFFFLGLAAVALKWLGI